MCQITDTKAACRACGEKTQVEYHVKKCDQAGPGEWELCPNPWSFEEPEIPIGPESCPKCIEKFEREEEEEEQKEREKQEQEQSKNK